MKNLIEELRACAKIHPLDIDLDMLLEAADAIESQAREIERLTQDRDSQQRTCIRAMEQLATISCDNSEDVPVAYVDDHYLHQLRCGRGFSIGVTPSQHRRNGENNGLYTKPSTDSYLITEELTKAKNLLEECITTLYCETSEGGEVLDRVNGFLAESSTGDNYRSQNK